MKWRKKRVNQKMRWIANESLNRNGRTAKDKTDHWHFLEEEICHLKKILLKTTSAKSLGVRPLKMSLNIHV